MKMNIRRAFVARCAKMNQIFFGVCQMFNSSVVIEIISEITYLHTDIYQRTTE